RPARSRRSCSSPKTPCTATRRASFVSWACIRAPTPSRWQPSYAGRDQCEHVAPRATARPANTLSSMLVGIVGLGYVGLPPAVAFADAGIDVVGVDVDQHKLTSLRAGRSYIEDVSDDAVAAVRDRLAVSADYAPLAAADAVLISVPTPLTANREPD